ncbi:unnamed protein product [Prunus armeniaca]
MVVAKPERGLKLEMLRFEVGDGGEMVVARLERGILPESLLPSLHMLEVFKRVESEEGIEKV